MTQKAWAPVPCLYSLLCLPTLSVSAAAVAVSTHCRFERLKETAFEYAFLLKTAGMLDVQPTPGSASTAAATATV